MKSLHAAWRICVLSVLCFVPAGAQIVPIQGSDSISDSRIVINNNFAYLDNIKIETASNVGSQGVGLFKLKSAKDLQIYKVSSGNALLNIALSGTDFLQFTMSTTPSFTSLTLSGNLTRTAMPDGCANWTSGVLGSSGTACGSAGGGEANVTADVGSGLSLRGTTAKSGVALNLRTLAATAPLTVTQGSDLVTFAMPAATGSVNGYLSSANFATFAAKYGSGDSPSFVNLTLSGAFTKTGTADGCAAWSAGVLGTTGAACGGSSGTVLPAAIVTMSGAQRSIPFATHGMTGPIGVTCKDASGNYSPNAYSTTATGSNFDVIIGAMTGTCYVSALAAGTGTGSGLATMVTGAADPVSACVAPSTSNLSLYTQTTTQDIWACMATNTWKKILSTTGTGTYVVTGTAGTAPATPAAGNVSCYFNSSSKVQICIDDAGATSETIRTPATLVRTIASGTVALATAAIGSGACATTVTATATGAATTDVVNFTPNADITSVTGYTPATTGGLAIYPFPTTNAANFKVCNPTASSITPGAVSLNWRINR